MSSDQPVSRRDWGKVGAIATIVGVAATIIIGFGTVILMWWFDYRAHHPESFGPQMPIAWWMPVLIASTILISSFIFYRAMSLSSPLGRTSMKSRLLAEQLLRADLQSAELKHKELANACHASELKLQSVEAERDRLEQQLALEKAKLENEKARAIVFNEEREQLKAQLSETRRELSTLKTLLAACQSDEHELKTAKKKLVKRLGQLQLSLIGQELKPRHLQVVIRFVDSTDRPFAEEIKGLFVNCAEPSPWRAEIDPDSPRYRTTEVTGARIVITSKDDDEISSNLKATINQWGLLAEWVAAAKSQLDESLNDVTITIYGHSNS